MAASLSAVLGFSILAAVHSSPQAQFLGRMLTGAESELQCVPDETPCQEGVECCGVCAYIGASTWMCKACTAVGEECIPMGNRCCDGGNKQKDIVLQSPQNSCKATSETSEKYGITKYTCQATYPTASGGLSNSEATPVSLMAWSGVRANVFHQGDASTAEVDDLRNFAYDCFVQYAVDTSNLGELQGSLGRATGCVLSKCQSKWGWKPFLSGSGSNNGGPYDVYGRGTTVVGVETASGSWQFVLEMQHRDALLLSIGHAKATSLHRGDATDSQLADLLAFSEDCFDQHRVDTSSEGGGGAAVARLEVSLGRATGCVLSHCESKWGWKPFLSGSGSNGGGPYDAYGLGATVVGVETSAGSWQFILMLKA